MKPPPFKYYAPDTLEEALGLMAEYGSDAKALAGGQSLIPTMNFRLSQPEVLVDLNNIPKLSHIQATADGGLSIGAMTRQRAVERDPLVAQRSPLIHATMPYIAHPQIRNRGTFGGSIAHADPASELPAVITVLEARLRVQSSHGERWISANEFFTDLFETALEPEELLVEVSIPETPPRTGYAFQEVSRRHGDYALVGAAASVTLSAEGVCDSARLAFFSVGPGPVSAHQAAASLTGQALTAESIDQAAEIAAANDIDPPGDIHASVSFRRHLAKTLARRVLTEAATQAQGG
ncbi:MAG: xanthine dehydrogenase family protein subunit M [Chloroflexota bacterium]